jgi:hypothetical protein
VTLREGVAVERESYFDPAPLIAAIVRAPRLWPRFVQLQLRARIPMTNKRRRTQ